MSLVPLAVRSTVLVLTFVPRLYRTLLWRILLSAEVPLAITAPLGAALAVLLFWAPAAILIPTAAPLVVHATAWGAIAVGATFSAVRWLMVEVVAGRV